MGWFTRKDETVANVAAIINTTVPFHEKMLGWVDGLDWYEKESSGYISPEAFSILRRMNDLFREIAVFLQTYEVRAEEEYILESTLLKYIPDTLKLFNQLPEGDRIDGGDADKQLIQQFGLMFTNVKDLNKQMHDNVRKELSQQTAFVEDRFNNLP